MSRKVPELWDPSKVDPRTWPDGAYDVAGDPGRWPVMIIKGQLFLHPSNPRADLFGGFMAPRDITKMNGLWQKLD